MWLIACGMNRSGSTLQYQIAVKIAQTQPKVEQVGWIAPTQTDTVLGSATDSEDTWYLAKLHNYDKAVEQFYQKFQPKAVYIYRDIRDVVVSLINQQGWALDSPDMGYAVYHAIQNYFLWTQQPDIMISRYEDVMAQGGLITEVEKIARYMEVELSQAEAMDIATSVSLDENRRYIETFDYQGQGLEFTNSRFDPISLLHNNHIHSGAVEQWRTALTPEQAATVERWAGIWLKDRGYPIGTPPAQQQIELLRYSLERQQQIERLGAQLKRSEAQITEYETRLAEYAARLAEHEARFASLRSRKIVSLMQKLGRPLF